MDDQSWLKLLQQYRAIAVIRSPQQSLGLKMAQAVAAGGIRLIEITWNSQSPGSLITQLRSQLPDYIIGAGTILNKCQLNEAIAAKAQFLFSPHTNPLLIQGAIAAGIPIVPGALSATEIVTAWQAGASCVKVFPSQAGGGANYIKSLQGPLGQIPLIPTGGVTLNNASEFLAAGAIAVGLSSQLFPQELIAAEDWQGITERAKFLQEKLLINC
ncbi:MAG: bifunctional 4-hydroxy-2-oxoglutarate aldolase/2-dehydro-3-deoxy-phosphogluconate aldolase [Spirulinaceae cyanobacterium]